MRRSLRLHLAVLVGFTLVALILTWPLAAHFSTHVTGDGIDDPSLAWNLWWARFRLVDQLAPDIFHVGWMFHPVGINLAFYTLTPLNGLLSLPLQFAFGLVVASNVLLLLSFVLSAYGAFLLARWTLSQARPRALANVVTLSAILAGFLYAFAAPKLFYAALGQFNIASSQWVPFCILYLMRLAQARAARVALREGALAGLFLLLQAWAELTYASFLLLFLAIVALVTIVRLLRGTRQWRTMLAGFGILALLFLVGIAPFLAAMMPDLRDEGDFFASGGGFADIFSADLAGFLLPTRLHPWLGSTVAALPFPNDKGQQIYLGWIAMLLAVAGGVWLWRRARAQALVWLPATLFFWLLTLGPSLRWMGRDLGIPGPFAAISLLPFFNGNRYPSRYGVMLLICVAVLAAAGMVATMQRLRLQRARALALVGAGVLLLVALEHLSTPLPLSDLRIPSVYARLAAEPGDLAVLELPTGWRNGARVLGRSDILIMMQQWYQTAHGKRRLGGNTSRNPAHKFQFFTEHPLVGDLIALMNTDQDGGRLDQGLLDAMTARHAPVAAQELADLGVGWVTLHEERATPELIAFVERALPLELVERWQGSDWNGAPAAIRLYRVTGAAGVFPRTFDLAADAPPDAQVGSSPAQAWLAQGWSSLSAPAGRYANRPRAELVLPLPDGVSTLTLDASGLVTAPTVAVNDASLALLGSAQGVFTYTLPAGVASQPVDRVTLRLAAEGAPVTALAMQPSPIGATGVSLAPGVTLVAESAGEPVGDFARIWLDGVDVARGGRGYNLAAFTQLGALLGAETFDTHFTPQESSRMAEWIRQWPAGTVIAGAVEDEGSRSLGEEAVDALRSLGVAADLRGRFRASHAFVGVMGSAAGSALEAVSTTRPARVWLGAPVDGARAWGPIQSLTVSPALED